MRVRVQAPHLRGGSLDDLLSPVADVRVPEPCRGVEVAAALGVPHVRPFAAVEKQLAGLRDGVHVGDRVPETGHGVSLARFGQDRSSRSRPGSGRASRPGSAPEATAVVASLPRLRRATRPRSATLAAEEVRHSRARLTSSRFTVASGSGSTPRWT